MYSSDAMGLRFICLDDQQNVEEVARRSCQLGPCTVAGRVVHDPAPARDFLAYCHRNFGSVIDHRQRNHGGAWFPEIKSCRLGATIQKSTRIETLAKASHRGFRLSRRFCDRAAKIS